MENKSDVVKKILAAIAMTREEEADCGAVFEVVDQVAEAVVQGQPLAEVMPLIKHHLALCQGCSEEFEALLRVLEHDLT